MKRRKALKRSQKRLKRSPLRRVSLQRNRELRRYYALRRAYLRAHPFCEAMVDTFCKIRADQIHHMNGRNGGKLNETFWFLSVCLPCHEWIENNKKEARKKGLIVYQ